MKLKQVLKIFLCFIVMFTLASCSAVKDDAQKEGENTTYTSSNEQNNNDGEETKNDQSDKIEEDEMQNTTENAGKTPVATITMENGKTIKIELDPVNAPITTENFVNLASSGFYNGLTFHRIVPGFVIQGGDPEGTGYGGSEKTIKGEFLENGVKNDLKHTKGVISMARSMDPNSASSQFFIVLETSPMVSASLDGKYAAFGIVTEGIEVVDEIAAVQTNAYDAPIQKVVMKSVEISYKD